MAPTEYLTVKPSQIAVNFRNVRKSLGPDEEITELADSIKTVGLLEPLVIAPWPDTTTGKDKKDGKHLLIAGHRRLAAAKLAKLKEVPVLLRHDLDTEAKQVAAMLAENGRRRDLTPIEEADGYQLLLDFGETIDQIATTTGATKKTVRDRIKLGKLPDTSRDRIQTGQVTLTDAQALAEFAGDEVWFSALEDALGTTNWHWTLQRSRNARKGERKRTARVRELKKAGVTVLDDYPEEAEGEELTWADLDEIAELIVDFEVADPEDFEKVVDAHKDCPGHAVIVTARTWGDAELVEVPICTDVDKHHPAKDGEGPRGVTDHELPGTSEEKAAERQRAKEAQEARDKLVADVATAAQVRRQHIGGVIRSGDTDLARDLVLRSLRPHLQGTVGKDLEFTAELLGVDPDDAADKIAGLTVSQLVILREILEHKWEEHRLSVPDYWPASPSRVTGNGWDPSGPWRKVLTETLGYEWSDIELSLLGEAGDEPAQAAS